MIVGEATPSREHSCDLDLHMRVTQASVLAVGVLAATAVAMYFLVLYALGVLVP